MEVLGGHKIKSPGNFMNCEKIDTLFNPLRAWREGGADGRGQGWRKGAIHNKKWSHIEKLSGDVYETRIKRILIYLLEMIIQSMVFSVQYNYTHVRICGRIYNIFMCACTYVHTRTHTRPHAHTASAYTCTVYNNDRIYILIDRYKEE